MIQGRGRQPAKAALLSQLAQRASEDFSHREALGSGIKHMPQKDPSQRTKELGIYTSPLSVEAAPRHL